MKNKDKKEEKPKQKKHYTVKLDSMCPCVLTFKVLAETPEEAAEMVRLNYQSPISVKPKIAGKKDKKITVYELGSSIIKFIRNFWN